MSNGIETVTGTETPVSVLEMFGVEEISKESIPTSQVGRRPGTGNAATSPWGALVDHAIAIAPQGKGVRFKLPEGRKIKALRSYLYDVARRRNVLLSVSTETEGDVTMVYAVVMPGTPRVRKAKAQNAPDPEPDPVAA